MAAIVAVGLAMSACLPATPRGPAAASVTPTGASTPVPSAATAAPSATTGASGSATPEAQANATTTAEAQATVIARAVQATISVEVPALATAAALSAQQTATAATPSSAAAGSATPAALTPASAATASPSGAVALACPVQPVRGFGLLYNTNPTVAARLGCASEPEAGVGSAAQMFENGLMLEFGGGTQILVLQNGSAKWSAYDDAYQRGQTLPTPTVIAPSGRYAPVGSFGLLWQRQPQVRSQLGWATAPAQQSASGAQELFAHGRMLWLPTKIIYVLYSDNTWESFPDKFQG